MRLDDVYLAYPRSERFKEEFICPRAIESGREGKAIWSSDETCSWCGSLNPDLLMERIAVDISLGPTDKSYKVYVKNKGGQKFKQTFRGSNCPGGTDPSKWVWTTRETDDTKFYFQHLSEDQKREFVKLLNEKKLFIDYPGHFYRLPYFCQVVK
jgi:hypothetical protein